jgi:hypothetical protein
MVTLKSTDPKFIYRFPKSDKKKNAIGKLKKEPNSNEKINVQSI